MIFVHWIFPCQNEEVLLESADLHVLLPRQILHYRVDAGYDGVRFTCGGGIVPVYENISVPPNRELDDKCQTHCLN